MFSPKTSSRIFKPLMYILLGMLLTPFVITYGPKIEGMVFPVITGTKITHVTTDPDTNSISVWGSANKRRACGYNRMEWHYNPGSTSSTVVPILFRNPPVVHPNGHFTFGPWDIDFLTRQDVIQNSFVQVFHRCHPFWLTESRFYP